MKYWIHVVIILLVGIFLGQFFPWWAIAVIAVISAFVMKHKYGLSAMFGFLAGFLLWAGLAFYGDVENHHLLSSKMGILFGGLNTTVLILLTGLIGGVITSLGSMVGSAIAEIAYYKSTKVA